MLEFQAGSPLSGRLMFRASEHSFSYEVADDEDLQERLGDEGSTSIVADTLQLEVGVETGQLLFAWGYLPAASWLAVPLPRPEVVPGVLRLLSVEDLEPGVSLSISRSSDWKAEFDQEARSLRVSVDGRAETFVAKIAEGVAVGLQDGQIHSVWLWPEFVP